MENHFIVIDDKRYKVKPPTLTTWFNFIQQKDFVNDYDMALFVLSQATGLSQEEIVKGDAIGIYNAATELIKYYTEIDNTFHQYITFNGVKYKFIDFKKLSFAEFIDLDEILKKPFEERMRLLPRLMAIFYRIVDNNDEYEPYDVVKIEKTAEVFKDLPINYFQGAMVFFYSIENILQGNTRFYLFSKNWMKLMILRIIKTLKVISGGMRLFITWLMRIYYRWTKWLGKTILKYSTS